MHRKGTILRHIFEYFLMYIHAYGTAPARSGSAVCVQFVCSLCAFQFVRALWIARLLCLICTGLAATKAVHFFCGSGPKRSNIFGCGSKMVVLCHTVREGH